MANAQLVLLPTDTKWKLDEDTRRIGRAGLAQARAILVERSANLEAPLETQQRELATAA